MADASKLKKVRRQGLGSPPPLEEARIDLALPSEQSMPPTEPIPGARPNLPVPGDKAAVLARGEIQQGAPAEPPRADRIDGRTLRRSGRTIQFATRVSLEFDERVRQIALRDKLLLVEVLERALDAYEVSSKK